MASAAALAELRQRLAEIAPSCGPDRRDRVGFGEASLDRTLAGGLARGALHEVFAASHADLSAATGFALALAWRAAAGTGPILWARQDMLEVEAGHPHPSGLAELGLEPAHVLLVRGRDATAVLRAGQEGARCAALGAVLIEPWGEPKRLDLTASRRLALAAAASGVTVLLLRAARPSPSAAETRWRVESLPSRPLEANAPGYPAFGIGLIRNRSGLPDQAWRVEWNRDERSFQERQESPLPVSRPAPLPRPVVSSPADGQDRQGWRKAG